MLTELPESSMRAADAEYPLNTAPDPRFDRIVRIAQRICGTSMAALSFCDSEMLWHKARIGISNQADPLENHLARHVLASDAPLVLADARNHRVLGGEPMVLAKPGIGFFACVPVHDSVHGLIGCLTIMDRDEKSFGDADLQDLRDLAELAGELADTAEAESRDTIDSCERSIRNLERDLAPAIGNAFMDDYSLGTMLLRPGPGDASDPGNVHLVWINRTGATHLSLLHPGDREVPINQLMPRDTAKVIAEGVHAVRSEPRLRQLTFSLSRVGEVQHFTAKMVPCGDEVVFIFGNVTEQLRTSLHAIKTVELFNQMTGLISHDMRGPLRRICQFIDILRDEGAIKQSEHEEFFGIVQSQARALSTLIVDSIHYSRTLMTRPSPVLVSVQKALEEGFSHTLRVGDYGGVSFEARGDWGTTLADPKLLNQAFRGLFTTMLQFRRPMVRPEINIEATIAGGRQQILIRDNGLPVPEILDGQLFSFRSRRPMASGEQYMMLGFSLASEIIQDIGGDIMADPTYKDGICLLIDLPLGRLPNPDRVHDLPPSY